MLQTLESCRKTWNVLLSKRQASKLSKYDCDHEVYLQKQKTPYLREVYSHVLQNVSERLDLAFQHFFRRLREGKTGRDLGYPRFRKYGCYGSFTYPDAYNGSVKLGSALKKTKLYLSKIGYVPVRVSRSHPEQVKEREGETLYGLKTCTVKRESDKWFAVLVYETKQVLPRHVEAPERPIGIDLGLTSIITTSDGVKIEPLKPLKKNLKRLAQLQHVLSRRVAGICKCGSREFRVKKGFYPFQCLRCGLHRRQSKSRNRFKAQSRVSALHWRIGMRRRDALHKLTSDLALQHDLIVFEDLNIKGMVKNHSLAGSFSDVSLSEVVRLASYKVERYGHRVVLVSPNYTSTDCSSCGFRREMPLSVRIFHCEKCGLVIDRDWNSARTILFRGLQQVGQVIARTQACGEWSPVSSDTQPLVEAGSGSPSL